MSPWTFRAVVIASLLSSFLVGMHVPALHEMIDHGATPRTSVVAATLVLVVLTVAGAAALLRDGGSRNSRR